MQDPGTRPDTFENTYPKYPFSELVRLSLILARWVIRRQVTVEIKPHQGNETCARSVNPPCKSALSTVGPGDAAADVSLQVRRQRKTAQERVRSR